MSFNRAPALEAQPTTFRREDDPQYADDPEFNRFTTDLSDKLFSMTSNINQLSRQVDLLGTRRETERVRERVQDLVEETGNAFKEIGEGLKKVTTWQDLGVWHGLEAEQSKLSLMVLAFSTIHTGKAQSRVPGVALRVSTITTASAREAARVQDSIRRIINPRHINTIRWTAPAAAAATATAGPGTSPFCEPV